MFKPIIHNLTEHDHAFAACQHYNRLIERKPKINGTLEQKLEAIRQWEISCLNALNDAQTRLKA